MLTDLLLHSAYPGLHYSALSGRCPRCGQGTVVASDGFMAVLCDNCGRHFNYDHPHVRRSVLEALIDFTRRAWRGVARLTGVDRPPAPVVATEGA